MENFLQLLKKNREIPIVGKGTKKQLEDNFYKLISKNFKVIEITLRSEESLEVAIFFKKKFPDLIIGLGSIISFEQLVEVSKKNFNFYVSPGYTHKMLEFSFDKTFIYIPGVSNSNHIMECLEYNIKLMKFFHAENNGGIKALDTYKDIFREVYFIPTGGINNKNKESYLNLNNVLAVGATSF